MSKLTNKDWWLCVLERSIKTFFQTFVAVVGTAFVISDVDWLQVLSASGLSAILSVATSIATIPEPEEPVTMEQVNKEIDEMIEKEANEDEV